MQEFLVNLLIGIVGGIYSSVIVSRVFLLREELEEQLNILKKKTYYFGTLTAFFDVIEVIKKLQSDTSHEIEEEIRRDPEYLRTHDLIHASDAIRTMKKDILDKAIEKLCDEDNPLVLKQKHFIELKNETEMTVRKYKNIDQFKFETIDNAKKEVKELKEKYEKCLRKRNRYLICYIVKDKIIIGLCILLIVLCVLIPIVK